MQAPSIKTPSVEIALRSVGDPGLTIKELMEATGLPETTIRRQVNEHTEANQLHKVPTIDGAKHVWGPKPEARKRPGVDDVSPRRREAWERDQKVLEVLRVNQRISCNEIARILDMPDIDQDGWSQLTYLSLRRLRRKGLTERQIVWQYIEPKRDLDLVSTED